MRPSSLRFLAIFLSSFLLPSSLPFAQAQCPLNPTNPSVTICTPANGATVTSPVHVVAGTTSSIQVVSMLVYDNNTLVYKVFSNKLDTSIAMAPGKHTLIIKAWQSTGAHFDSAPDSITVSTSTAPAPTIQFSASPTSITAGQSSTLTWSTTNATSVNIQPAVGTVGLSGSATVSPAATTTYTATATGAGGSARASATVTVPTTSCTNSSVGTVRICAPVAGTSVTSPVQFISQALSVNPIAANWVYVDNIVVFKNSNTPSVKTSLNIAPGTHTARVQTWDSKGTLLKAGVLFTVIPGTGISVSINPKSASVVTGGTQSFTATVSGTQNTSVNWLVDGVAGGATATGTINGTGLYAAPNTAGSHTVTAQSVADPSKTANATVTVSGLSVHPARVAITVNQTQQFTASASSNWSVDNIAGGNSTVGTIDATGLYQPPSTTGAHTITATMQSNATSTADAAVYVENHPGVFTYHYDNQRTGQNTQEIALSPSTVNKNTFGKLFSRTLDGWTFTEPLYVPNVAIPGQGTFNVVYIATEHDSVYAFDADGQVTSPFWHVSFIDPGNGITTLSASTVTSSDPGPETGITGTPVIDLATGTMYLVSQRTNHSVVETHLHALDIATGGEKFGGPALVQATAQGSGAGSVNGEIAFNGLIEHSRPGVLLVNGTVYIAFASLGDHGLYHGWVLAYDAGTLTQLAVFNATPNGIGGGVWQAGAGLASDGSAIYFATGNGTFDVNGPVADYGDSYVKLAMDLSAFDFFTPFDEQTLLVNDIDLGSSGLFLPPDQSGVHPQVIIGSGKRGDIYVVDRESMGHMQPGSNSQIVQYLPRALGVTLSGTDEFFGNGVYWNGNVYFVGSVDKLKQFSLSGGLLSTTPVHQSPQVLSSPRSAQLVVSSDGNNNGIVWVIQSNAGNAVLHAFKATDVSQELYNSTQAGSRDSAAKVMKFSTPTVVNGKVFIGTETELDVYGLLP